MAAGRVIVGRAWESAWCWRDSRAAVRSCSMAATGRSSQTSQKNQRIKENLEELERCVEYFWPGPVVD